MCPISSLGAVHSVTVMFPRPPTLPPSLPHQLVPSTPSSHPPANSPPHDLTQLQCLLGGPHLAPPPAVLGLFPAHGPFLNGLPDFNRPLTAFLRADRQFLVLSQLQGPRHI